MRLRWHSAQLQVYQQAGAKQLQSYSLFHMPNKVLTLSFSGEGVVLWWHFAFSVYLQQVWQHFMDNMLVFYCCHQKLLQMQQLKTNYLTVLRLEVQAPTSTVVSVVWISQGSVEATGGPAFLSGAQKMKYSQTYSGWLSSMPCGCNTEVLLCLLALGWGCI